MGFRTKETQERYDTLRENGHLDNGCRLCDAKTLEEFTFWRIVGNMFPYDMISDVHHMLIPKRHVIETELTEEEEDELSEIKHTYLGKHYSYMLEALTGQKSIPEHLHFHIIVPKDF